MLWHSIGRICLKVVDNCKRDVWLQEGHNLLWRCILSRIMLLFCLRPQQIYAFFAPWAWQVPIYLWHIQRSSTRYDE